MQTLNGEFTIEAGKRQDGQPKTVTGKFPFSYRQFDSLSEAQSSTDWTEKHLLEVINSYEKSSARATEYQRVTAPDRPDTSTPEYKRSALIKNLVSMGVPEDVATQQIDAMLSSAK